MRPQPVLGLKASPYSNLSLDAVGTERSRKPLQQILTRMGYCYRVVTDHCALANCGPPSLHQHGIHDSLSDNSLGILIVEQRGFALKEARASLFPLQPDIGGCFGLALSAIVHLELLAVITGRSLVS